MKKKVSSVLLGLALLVSAAGCESAGQMQAAAPASHPEKLSRELQGLTPVDPSSSVDVIVQYKHAPTEAQHQKVRDRGGVVKSKLDAIQGGAYTISAGTLADLTNDPEVSYVSPDRKLGSMLDLTAAAVNV